MVAALGWRLPAPKMRASLRLLGTVFGIAACQTGGSVGNTVDVAADAAAGLGDAGVDCGAIAAPNAWASWVMPNPPRSGMPHPASYTASDTGGEVTDDVTGLVWQRGVSPSSYTWDDARQTCACSTSGGFADWRLPSRIELASIADWTTSSPAIDSVAFPATPSENFWTASKFTTDIVGGSLAYVVYFGAGFTTYDDPGQARRVRCVRGGSQQGSSPPGRYTIAGGAVYDTLTMLTWQQTAAPQTYAWADAKAYCTALSLDGAGWRLPGIGELQTIVDEPANPSVDAAAFPMTPSEYFWSSSADVADPTRAWTCYFANGSTYRFALTKPRYVRCVR
jgi:hypothetical protein